MYFLTACCAVITLSIMARARHNQNVKASVHLKKFSFIKFCLKYLLFYVYLL
jgi:hypothetical protein